MSYLFIASGVVLILSIISLGLMLRDIKEEVPLDAIQLDLFE